MHTKTYLTCHFVEISHILTETYDPESNCGSKFLCWILWGREDRVNRRQLFVAQHVSMVNKTRPTSFIEISWIMTVIHDLKSNSIAVNHYNG